MQLDTTAAQRDAGRDGRWPPGAKKFTIALLKTVPIDGFGQSGPSGFYRAVLHMVRRQIVINRRSAFSLARYTGVTPLYNNTWNLNTAGTAGRS